MFVALVRSRTLHSLSFFGGWGLNLGSSESFLIGRGFCDRRDVCGASPCPSSSVQGQDEQRDGPLLVCWPVAKASEQIGDLHGLKTSHAVLDSLNNAVRTLIAGEREV